MRQATYVLQQPKIYGVQPKFSLKFRSEAEAEAYKEKLIDRMKLYVAKKALGHKVGNKTLEELNQELLEIQALQVVRV